MGSHLLSTTPNAFMFLLKMQHGLEPDAEAQGLCSLRCTLAPAARATLSAYSRLAARLTIRSGTRYAKWAGGSRSQTHRRAAMGGFTQDDGYVRGVAADAVMTRIVGYKTEHLSLTDFHRTTCHV